MVIAAIPGHAEVSDLGVYSGGFVELAQAMDEAYDEGKIKILGIYPFKRCLLMVEKGKADAQLPLMNREAGAGKGLIFSTTPIGTLTAVLYSRADKPAPDLNHPDIYSFDVLRGNTESAQSELGEVSSIESGMLKVLTGRSDGFIIPQDEGDAFIRSRRLKNLRRQLDRREPIHLVFRQGPEAEVLDRIFTDIITRLETDGRLRDIMDRIHRPFEDWQPYKTDW